MLSDRCPHERERGHLCLPCEPTGSGTLALSALRKLTSAVEAISSVVYCYGGRWLNERSTSLTSREGQALQS